MQRFIFIVFLIFGTGLFQCYNCIASIENRHIASQIDYDEFTTANALQFDESDDEPTPIQKKKRKRIKTPDQNIEIATTIIEINFQSVKGDYNLTVLPDYSFYQLFYSHKRGPPSLFS